MLFHRPPRRRVAVAAGLAVLVLSGCGNGTARAGSAAVVGEDAISTDDLTAVVERGLADPAAAQQFGAERETYQRQVLARLINRMVLAEAAQREGLEVTQGDVDAQLAEFAEQSGGQEALESQAAQSGISATDLPDFIRDIVVERELGDALTENVDVPQEQLEALYQENIAEYDQVRSRHILVAEEAPARDLLAQVQADPTTFEALAAEFSTDTSNKDNGGDLGFAGRGSFVPEFEQLLFTAEPGTYDVVNTQFGWHVVHVIERQTTPLSEVEDELRRNALQDERTTRTQELLRATANELEITVNPRFGQWSSETGTVEPDETPNGVSSPESDGEAPADEPIAPGGEQPGEPAAPEQPAPSPHRVTGRLTVLVTSPHVPAGLLSWPAWQALRSGPVQTAAPDHPQLAALRATGVEVTVVETPLAALSVPSGQALVWLASAADADAVAALEGTPGVELLHGSVDPPGARLLDVVAVMDRLRSPGGCPWDADQTHASLAPYLLEEAYEAYATLEEGDLPGLREELGDVLLQVVFHARLAQELPEPWSVDDVAGDLVDKLVRRHPHVFAGADASDVERSWDAIKAKEKGGRTSVTDGVPLSQPALSLALKLQKRAGRLGAPVELPARAGDQLAVALWDVVRRCREQRVDPEAALRSVARAFRDRLARVEADLRRAGRDPADLTPREWSERWS